MTLATVVLICHGTDVCDAEIDSLPCVLSVLPLHVWVWHLWKGWTRQLWWREWMMEEQLPWRQSTLQKSLIYTICWSTPEAFCLTAEGQFLLLNHFKITVWELQTHIKKGQGKSFHGFSSTAESLLSVTMPLLTNLIAASNLFLKQGGNKQNTS